MLKLSHFFMLFFLCNTTHILHSMDRDSWYLEDSLNVREYRETKEAAKQKKERQKKNQNTYCKKNNGNVLKPSHNKTNK